MEKDLLDRLKRIESSLYAIAQAQDKLIGLLTEEAEDTELQETDLDGNTNGGGERDQNEPL